jgi:hypothetical protein
MKTDQPPQPHTTFRPLIVIPASIAALIAATAAVVLLAGNRSAEQFPVDSPEGVVQGYLASFDNRDYQASYAFFSDRVHAAADFAAYESVLIGYGYHGDGATARRVLIDSVTGSGDRRVLSLTVEEFQGEGLSGSSYRYARHVRLVRQPDGWRIDELLVWLDPAPLMQPAH